MTTRTARKATAPAVVFTSETPKAPQTRKASAPAPVVAEKTWAALVAATGAAPDALVTLASEETLKANRVAIACYMAADAIEPGRDGSRVPRAALKWSGKEGAQTATVDAKVVSESYGVPSTTGHKLLSVGRIALGHTYLTTDDLIAVLVIVSRNGKTKNPDGTVAKVPSAATVKAVSLLPDAESGAALIAVLKSMTQAQETKTKATPEGDGSGAADESESVPVDPAESIEAMVSDVIDIIVSGDITTQQGARIMDALADAGFQWATPNVA